MRKVGTNNADSQPADVLNFKFQVSNFEFAFNDERIDAQYRNPHDLGKIISTATLLSVLIGEPALYGLPSAVAAVV